MLASPAGRIGCRQLGQFERAFPRSAVFKRKQFKPEQ
jgi:hypothetical protein